MRKSIKEEATALNMNPWVVAWARTKNIEPATLIRTSLDDDLACVGNLPWTILYSEWIQAKWKEWRSWCPDPSGQTCFGHCHDSQSFSAWLCEGKQPERFICPVCRMKNSHKLQCPLRSDGGQARLSVKNQG